MADRSVRVQLTAQVQGYIDGMEKAAKATGEVGSQAEKLAQQQQAFEALGRGAIVAGGAMAAGLALSAKAAIDWESAWAGVTKTVDGTPEQLADIEQGLRDMTSVLPASHAELAAVAEAAGQLGIQTPNILAFTKTMIDLGETTNLTSDQAATSLARFMNVMGTSQDKVSNLGSALVDLGNNYATTEAEILEMAQRLAGAGVQIGMSEGQVLGLSTALSSVGIDAEAGGSAMSKVMIDIASSVDKGGARLELFAKVAGVSADTFAAKWKTDPGAALADFVGGLANAESQGMSTLGVLEELGITEVRMRDALLRSSSAADEFAAAMEDGNSAFAENNALTAEAEKRYETTAAQLTMMKNQIVDAAIAIGENFLPALERGAEVVGAFADMIGGLEGPAAGAVAWLGAATAAALLGGGVFMASVPKIAAYKAALATLGPAAQRAGAGLSMAAKGAGLFAAAMVVIEAADMLTDFTGDLIGASKSADDLAKSLTDTSTAGKAVSGALTGGHLGSFIAETAIADGNLRALNTGIGELVAKGQSGWLGDVMSLSTAGFTGKELGRAKENIEQLDAALAQMTASGDVEAAAKGQRDFAKAAEEAGWSTEKIAEALPLYAEAQKSAAKASEEGADGIDLVAEAADAAAGELSEMKAALDGVAGSSLSMGEAQDAALSAINRLTEAAEAEGATLQGTDNASIALRDSMRDVETSSRDSATAILENKGSMEEAMVAWQAGRDKVIEMRMAMGESRGEAVAWADQNLGSAAEVSLAMSGVATAVNAIPAGKNIDVTVSGNALAKIQEINSWLASTPDTKHISISGTGGISGLANGGVYEGGVKAFANSGFEPGIYDYKPGGIHKFAEEYGEAYISMDPARHDRSVGVWQEAGRQLGQGGGGGGGQSSGPVVVSLAGASFVASIDGRPITLMIQEQIASADSRGGTTVSSGIGRDY